MPKKRIVLCSDGTWQSANNGSRAIPSNVAKISRALECWDNDVVQIVYYDTGIGTNVTSEVKADGTAGYSMIGDGINGAGLSENVCEAYNFVVNNYTKGDEIYIFGFSRGAYTARATAGLLAEVGVCSNSMMDQFWEMYQAYKGKKSWQSIKDTAWGQSTDVAPTMKESNGQYWLQKGKGKEWLAACEQADIQVVGVFDTVGALGWPDGAIGNSYWKNLDYGFHNTDVHPQIKNAFHALAIDEHRRPFTPTLWYKPDGSPTNLIQCWFPGVHINIGGGSDDALRELTKQLGDLEGMANVSLAWMVDRVREFTNLKFNDTALDIVVARYMDNMSQVLRREIQSNVAASKSYWSAEDPIAFRGWGVGPMADSYDEQGFWMRTGGGSRTRAPGRYLFRDTTKDGLPAAQKNTNEFIHPVVDHAWSDPKPYEGSYRPSSKKSALGGALFGFSREAADSGKGCVYSQDATVKSGQPYIDSAIAKKTTGAEWTSDDYPYWHGKVVIPEFQIPPETGKFKSMERRLIKTGPLEEVKITWTGQAMLENLKTQDPKSYNEMLKDMTEQNERAKASLAKWDKANGFA